MSAKHEGCLAKGGTTRPVWGDGRTAGTARPQENGGTHPRIVGSNTQRAETPATTRRRESDQGRIDQQGGRDHREHQDGLRCDPCYSVRSNRRRAEDRRPVRMAAVRDIQDRDKGRPEGDQPCDEAAHRDPTEDCSEVHGSQGAQGGRKGIAKR